MQPPIPPPTGEMSRHCPRCGTLITGRPPFCPNCGEPLAPPINPGYPMPPSESSGVTCLKVFAALALGGVAMIAGLMGACFALFGTQGGMNGQKGGLDLQMLGIAAVCFAVLVGCIAGLIAIFRKRS